MKTPSALTSLLAATALCVAGGCAKKEAPSTALGMVPEVTAQQINNACLIHWKGQSNLPAAESFIDRQPLIAKTLVNTAERRGSTSADTEFLCKYVGATGSTR